MMYSILGAVALAALVSACTSEPQEQSSRAESTLIQARVDVPATPTQPARLGHDEADAPAGLDACSIARHVSLALDTLRRWPRTIVAGGRDECVLAVLDSLGDRFIATGGAEWLAVLDSIHAVDDGYVAEYVPELTARMARARFGELFTYLYERRATAPPLESALAEAMRSDNGQDSVASREAWLALARSAVPAAALDTQRRHYLDALMKRADSSR